MGADSFPAGTRKWLAIVLLGFAIFLFSQFLVWEPWFGVPFQITLVLNAAAIAVILVGFVFQRRVVRARPLPPGPI
jgi:hypothetical protein